MAYQEYELLKDNKYFSLEKCSIEYKRNNFLALQAFHRIILNNGNVNALSTKDSLTKEFLKNGTFFEELSNEEENDRMSILTDKMSKLYKLIQGGDLNSLKLCNSSPLYAAVRDLFSSVQWNSNKDYLSRCYTSYLSDSNAPLCFDLSEALDSLIDDKGKFKEQPTFDLNLSRASRCMSELMKVADANTLQQNSENE